MEEKELLEFLKQIKNSKQELIDKMGIVEDLLEANKQQSPNLELVRKGVKYKSGLILPDIGMSLTTRKIFNENNRIIEISKRKHRCCFLKMR